MDINTAGFPTAVQAATIDRDLLAPSGRFRSFVDAAGAYASSVNESDPDLSRDYTRIAAGAAKRYAAETGRDEYTCLIEVTAYATAAYHLSDH